MKKTVQNKKPTEEISEYYKLELQEVFSRLNAIETFRAQLFTLVGTANLSGFGIAFSQQKAGIVILASLTMLFIIAVDGRLRKRLAAYYYRALQLQRRFAPDDDEIILQIHPDKMLSRIRQILELRTADQRQRALAKVHVLSLSVFGFWIPAAIMVIEASAAWVLIKVFSWSFF